MLRVKLLKDNLDRACHECGRFWYEVLDYPNGPDERPYAEVRGCIGQCLVVAILCPQCADEIIEGLWPSSSPLSILHANREYERDEVRGFLLARGEFSDAAPYIVTLDSVRDRNADAAR